MIYYDGTTLCRNKSGERYSSLAILQHLKAHFEVIIFIPSDYKHLKFKLCQELSISDDKVLILNIKRRTILILKILGISTPIPGINDNDIIWTSDYYVHKNANKQFCVVHDLMAIENAKYFSLVDRILALLFLRSKSFQNAFQICHSETVAKQIQNYTNINSSNLKVVKLGIRSGLIPLSKENSVHGARQIKLIYVSAYQKRKGFELLLNYFEIFVAENNIDIELTLIGFGIQDKLHSMHPRVKIIDGPTDQQKYDALQSSDIYINPSIAEGFGITNVEAQAYGLPVMCNDILIFREIMSDTAAYFSSHSYNSFSECLKRLLFNMGLFRDLRSLGYQNIKKYNFDDTLSRQLIPFVGSKISDLAPNQNVES